MIMNKYFDFNIKGKQNPYTTPNAFFDTLEEDIWKDVKEDYMRPKFPRMRVVMGSVAAIVASVALVLIFNMKFNQHSPSTISEVDQAFSQLSADDQDFLLSVYQDDVFIRE